MSIKTYDIPYFSGINQSGGENALPARYAIDAANMDTEGGCLGVAGGYHRISSARLPGSGNIELFTSMKTPRGEIPVAMVGGRLYIHVNGTWQLRFTQSDPASAVTCDSTMVRIESTDYLVIADGHHQMIKFDGETVTSFGSSEGCSDIPAAFLTMYRGRLFAAGDPDNPDRLYYSVLPGSGRTVENWGYVEASPAVEGGHTEVGSIGGDPIVAIKALSNQLLIFKKNSLYRLIGDRPSNFTIEHIDANMLEARHTAIAIYGDILYFVTKDGLYYYNGVTVRPCPDMRSIKRIMATADVTRSRAVIAAGKLYFSYKKGSDDEMMVYDLEERKYMRRTGFNIGELAVMDSRLRLINDKRVIYEFGNDDTYDGNPIEAFWRTPYTDLGDKAAIKCPRMLYLRGSGGRIRAEVVLDGKRTSYCTSFPTRGADTVVELPVFNEGRCISIELSNVEGERFTLEGGIELELAIRRRTE